MTQWYKRAVIIALVMGLSGWVSSCSEDAPTNGSEQTSLITPTAAESTTIESIVSAETPTAADQPDVVISGPQSLEPGRDDRGAFFSSGISALPGTSEIPYPVYPNGTKYRIGGENGLKIVVFETSDPFQSVDSFYNQYVGNQGLARLGSLPDYARYTTDDADYDPWATNRPGIVIHQFFNSAEATSYGAAPESKTNIIMSYR